jgi:hypothetical protein
MGLLKPEAYHLKRFLHGSTVLPGSTGFFRFYEFHGLFQVLRGATEFFGVRAVQSSKRHRLREFLAL